MTYEIKWKPNHFKHLHKLEKEVRKRIIYKIDKLMEDPFRYLKHYEGGDYYKLRVGDYRVLVDVNLKEKIIFIEVLDKRGKIYKKN